MKRIYCFFQDRARLNLHMELAKLKGIKLTVTGYISDADVHYTYEDRNVTNKVYSVEKLNQIDKADIIRFEDFFPKDMEKFQATQIVGKDGEVWVHGCQIHPRAPRKYEHKFEVGDIVEASRNTPLHCGSGIYPYAIVIQSEPLVLVSESGDMRWGSTNHEKILVKIGTATPEVLSVCMTRLNE